MRVPIATTGSVGASTPYGQDDSERTPGLARPMTRRTVVRSLARSGRLLGAAFVIGAVLGAVAAKRASLTYEGQSVVVATQTSLDPSTFGNLAKAAFATDTVLTPVVRTLGLNATPRTLLANGTLEADTVSGATAIRIIGRSSDPRQAAALANAGAESFVNAAQAKGLGTLAVFGASPLGTRPPQALAVAAIKGAVIAVLAAAVAILALVWLRHPVYSADDAAAELRPGKAFEARVRRPLPLWRGRTGEPEVRPRGVIPALWREVAARTPTVPSPGPCVILVERRRASDRRVDALMQALVTHYWASKNREPSERATFTWVRSSDDRLAESIVDVPVVVALIPEGVPSRRLADLDEELRIARDDQWRIVVVVR